jgi:hypothetical protein
MENQIRDKPMVEHLAAVIGGHIPKLTHLDMARNPTTGEGLHALFQKMVESGQALVLESLTLTGAPLADEGMLLVLPVLAENFPRLTYVNMTACRMSPLSIETVCTWVKHEAFKFPRATLKVEMQH